LSNKFYNGNKEVLRQFINDIFQKAIPPYLFESTLIRLLLKNISDGFPLTKKELELIVVSYFTKYLNSITKINDNVWFLYHNCAVTEWIPEGGGSFSGKSTKIPIANVLFISFIKEKDLDGFLINMVRVEPFDMTLFAVSEIAISIFGSYEKFGIFLNEQNEERSQYLAEYKELFEKFKDAQFQNFVPFDFIRIPIKTFRD
jgi:hypothetical protein